MKAPLTNKISGDRDEVEQIIETLEKIGKSTQQANSSPTAQKKAFMFSSY